MLNLDRCDAISAVPGHGWAPNTSPEPPIVRMKMEKPGPIRVRLLLFQNLDRSPPLPAVEVIR
jgi:hypothetical protein